MTRINCVPPSKLIDQHLVAEYREMLRLPEYLRKSYKTGKPIEIPLFYKMSAGHVKFFYDKGQFLKLRHNELKQEMLRRGMKPELTLHTGMFQHYKLMGDWKPTADAKHVNAERLIERINGMEEQPRFYKQQIAREEAVKMLEEYYYDHTNHVE